ncbi:hypothetical protein TSUD_272120 [Trifolium subterraneum]|uniref:Uncharacterized protein n=1 Tax=Trifolium subterraneum TaxID=3900 RepID=A0A2Z6NW97_TRISU|nr:hypothetical protein TSUD_272120 [Trifolium subterraneum]
MSIKQKHEKESSNGSTVLEKQKNCRKMLLNCPKIDVKGHYGMCAQSENSLYFLRQGAHLAVKETKQIHI